MCRKMYVSVFKMLKNVFKMFYQTQPNRLPQIKNNDNL